MSDDEARQTTESQQTTVSLSLLGHTSSDLLKQLN